MSSALSPQFEVFEDDMQSSGEKSDTVETQAHELIETKPRNLFEKCMHFFEVKQHTNTASNRRAESFIESFVYNDDLRPVEEKRRVWDLSLIHI